jgi:DNA-binding SARP family transcriptional activator
LWTARGRSPGWTDCRLDLEAFTALRSKARGLGEPDAIARTLRRALSLWQGVPLAGVRADFADAARARLREQRIAALEEMFDAELECANHRRIVIELTDAVADHPGHERLAGQLMIAMYRDGRATDALGVYRRVRQILADEYGLEPGAELRGLERSIRVASGTCTATTADPADAIPASVRHPRLRRPRCRAGLAGPVALRDAARGSSDHGGDRHCGHRQAEYRIETHF